ncbi:unnamed protein product [Cylicostephanus goldi]|uniref:Uncharacterized protein n=1 Tax=Cylicostephanus goldi TaxID=71465 RepID=A0A3P7Q280_CYLGO|nr:unnamed protein product [Cylicostephanus goldi]
MFRAQRHLPVLGQNGVNGVVVEGAGLEEKVEGVIVNGLDLNLARRPWIQLVIVLETIWKIENASLNGSKTGSHSQLLRYAKWNNRVAQVHLLQLNQLG